MKVTDEHVHDSKVLPKLVEDITKSKNMTELTKYLQMEPTIVMLFLNVCGRQWDLAMY